MDDAVTETPAAETPTNEFVLPACNLDQAREALERKVNRRARKTGCPEVTMTEVERFVRTTHEYCPERGAHCHGGDPCGRKVEWVRVRVEGETPKLPGYTFLGTLDHEAFAGDAVMVRAVPGHELPVEYRAVSPGRCDHCGKHRRRTETFVVRHDATGKTSVVGRQCVADYLGGQDPKRVVSWFAALNRFVESYGDPDGWGYGGYAEPSWSAAWVLAATVYVVHEYGWVSRAKARDTGCGQATADRVYEVVEGPGSMAPRHVQEEWQRTVTHVRETARYHERAAATVAWVEAEWADKPGASDYEYNVVQALAAPVVTRKTLGVVCSAYQAWRRANEERKAREARPVSKHVGQPKERFTVEAEVVFERETEGYYGTTHVIKLVTTDGNVLTWFASRPQEVEVGQRYEVTATVKKHDSYKGEAQTVVTRASLTALS